MHFVKLFADFQRCPVLGFWNVEPHKQAAAHTEEEEYKEAEALQTLLLKDFIFKKERTGKRQSTLPKCVTFASYCLIALIRLTTRMGKTIPTINRLTQFSVQATVYPADL